MALNTPIKPPRKRPIKLVGVATGRPIGAFMAFVRQLAHFVDAVTLFVGYLWPIWDRRNQTLADKIVGSVVIVPPPWASFQILAV